MISAVASADFAVSLILSLQVGNTIFGNQPLIFTLAAALSFFAGVRFVPVVCMLAHIAAGFAAFEVWLVIQREFSP